MKTKTEVTDNEDSKTKIKMDYESRNATCAQSNEGRGQKTMKPDM